MLKVESTSQHGRMSSRSSQNAHEAEKRNASILKTKRQTAILA